MTSTWSSTFERGQEGGEGRQQHTYLAQRHGKEAKVPFLDIQDADLLRGGLSFTERGRNGGPGLGDEEAPGERAGGTDEAFVFVPDGGNGGREG